MDENWTALAAAATQRRKALRLSQVELADAANVSRSTIQKLERGDGVELSRKMLATISEALGWGPHGAQVALHDGKPPAVVDGAVENRYRREPVSEGDAVGMVHNIVYKVVGTIAPGTSLAEFQELETLALEIAARYGFVPARRDSEALTDGTEEPTDP